MEEMKKDEALEEQQTTAEAAEATEAEAVQAEEIPDAVDETAEKIAKLEQQAADNLDKYQRTLAEFDNFRKRTIKEKAVMYDDGVRSTIEKLLTVIDNLERAVAVQEGKVDADDAFFKGVKMTLVQFGKSCTVWAWRKSRHWARNSTPTCTRQLRMRMTKAMVKTKSFWKC